MNLDHEDALRILVALLAARPDEFTDGNRPPMYGLWIPRILEEFCRTNRIDTRGDPSFYHREEFRGVWLAFYDAAWQLCRRGILRPGMNCPEGQGSGWGPPGDGFALTTAGREWLKHAAEAYFPTDPGRYVKTLEKPGRLLGDGFLQRAGEAASSHMSGNYLACCAMCGAAAESVLLAIAICKTEDEAKVLDAYGQRDGRRKVMRMIFDNPSLTTLGSRFETAFNLLTYWRDDAAHGRFSTISELEAYDALGRLLRLASLTGENWTQLTGRSIT